MIFFYISILLNLFVFRSKIIHFLKIKYNKKYKDHFEKFTKILNNNPYLIYCNKSKNYYLLNSKDMMEIIRKNCTKDSLENINDLNDDEIKILYAHKDSDSLHQLAYGVVRYGIVDLKGNERDIEVSVELMQGFILQIHKLSGKNPINSREYKEFHHPLYNLYRIKTNELNPIVINKQKNDKKLRKINNSKRAQNAIQHEMFKLDPAGEILEKMQEESNQK